jgi:hypothetical protein
MAVGVNGLGRCRVLCDRLDCDRKFVPRSPLVDVAETRARADLYGWSCAIPDARLLRWSAVPAELDFCPDHVGERVSRNGAVRGG